MGGGGGERELEKSRFYCLPGGDGGTWWGKRGYGTGVPTAYLGLWSSNNIKKFKKKIFFFLKFEIFMKIIPHAPYKVQKDRFRYL